MKIGNKVSDISLYPCPAHIALENYRVYDLQGATRTKYYTNGRMGHGFRTPECIITDTKYTGFHQAFQINGSDKFAIGYLNDHVFRQNKLEFIDLENGERVLELFNAYKFGKRYLAFRVNSDDGDITKHRWGLFDMYEGRLIAKPCIPTGYISKIFTQLEANFNYQPSVEFNEEDLSYQPSVEFDEEDLSYQPSVEFNKEDFNGFATAKLN